MNEMVQIRSVKQYFNDFIVKGLEGVQNIREHDMIRIKTQMLDAFQKEIFGQITFKLGPEAASMARDDLAKLDTVQNILVQSFRKWRRICILCSEHGLGNYFQLEDLRRVLEEKEPDPIEVITPEDEGVDVTEDISGEDVVYLEKSSAKIDNNAKSHRAERDDGAEGDAGEQRESEVDNTP